MVFAGIPFLFAFLPATLILYFAAPKKLKNTVLLLASLVFCFIGEQALVLVMLFSVTLNYFSALLIGKFKEKTVVQRIVFTATVICDLGMLGFFKYADFFIGNFSALTGLSVPLLKLALPLGISFYTFQILSYIIDVYRDKVEAEKNFINLAAYISLFPQLIAGPVVRYETVAAELRSRKHSLDDFAYGARRFVIGLSKKVLLANSFAGLIKTIGYSDEKTVLFFWMSAVAFTFQIYFDFSGYSDMAIGLGRIFGFHFNENFNYPYISRSIKDFWRRWHISLGSWFRDYLYIPLGGNRVGKFRFVINILIVWLLTGFWHGAEWNFILWGLLFGVLLLCEKLFLGKILGKIPQAIGVIYTLFFVVLGFVLFSADNTASAFANLSAMFGFSGLPFSGADTLYSLRGYAVLFVIATVAATPLVPKLLQKINRKALNIAEPVVLCVLLLLSTGYLIDGSFNPFIYFRF